MWLLSQIHLLALISYLYLALYVLLQNYKHHLNRSCALFILCLAVWSLEKVFYSAPGISYEEAWFWNNIGSFGWIGLSPAFLWFAQAMIGRTEAPRDRRLLKLAIVIGAFLWLIQYRRHLVSDFILMPYGWTWRWAAGFWTWAFFAYYLFFLLFGISLLYIYAGQPPAIPRKLHVFRLVIFTLVSMGMASLTDTIAPLLGIHKIPPVGNILCLLWAVWLGYTIATHQFLAISPKTAAENIIGTMSDLLILTDTRWHIVRVNRAAEECLGWEQSQLEGRHMFTVLQTDALEVERQFPLKKGRIENQRIEIRNRSGKKISAILSTTKLTDGEQPAGFVTLIKDITRLQDVETALKVSEERYRELVESINEVIFSLDESGELTYLSPAYENLTGYRIDEALHQNTINLLHPDDIEHFLRHKNSLFQGRVNILRARLLCKNGGYCWVQSSGRPVIADGKVVGANGILTDITEQIRAHEEKKSLEARLARAEKMEAIGTLAGAVAHDLNNVLSGIVSYPDLMLLELQEGTRQHKMLQTIKTSGEKAAAIVQDLLTLARRGVINTELLNLNQIVKEYLGSPEFLQLKNQSPQIQVNINLDENLNNILGSTVHLSKTIMNLMANAFEAIPNVEGEITLTTINGSMTPIPSTLDKKNRQIPCVILKVKDTGLGISTEDQERIFEPFFTRKVMGRSGTGLGMAVVWGAVQDHNGHIDIKSQIGNGTEFTLHFPSVLGKHPAKKRTSHPTNENLGKGESILIVDDVPDQRKIASDILLRLGYKVHAVSSGEKAIEFLNETAMDLVILDMVMEPGMDGLDTFRKICRIRPHQKVLIASGYSENDRIRTALESGVITCLKKPYLMEEIGSKVRAALTQSHPSEIKSSF